MVALVPRQSRLTEWHTLVVGLQGALVTGFIYAYSTYSNALQDQLKLTESNKELIGLAPSVCNLFTTLCGLLLDRTSVRFCLILSAMMMSGSYVLYGLVGMKVIAVSQPMPLCFALSFVASFGASFVVACTFSTLAKNFEAQRRSAVISVAKSWVGVASGVGTSIYIGFFPDNFDPAASHPDGEPRIRFLFFLAAICGVVPLAISGILRPLAPTERSTAPLAVPEAYRLPACYVISALLIATTLASAFEHTMPFSIALVTLLLCPLALLVPSGRQAVLKVSAAPVAEYTAHEQPRSTEPDASSRSNSTALDAQSPANRDPPAAGRSPLECGPAGMVKLPEFYLLFGATFAIQSGGLFLTTNLGSMVESRSGAAVAATTAVTIFSCFQGASRLVTGFVSDYIVSRGLPRTVVFPVLMLIMALAHAILCLRGPIALLAGTALGGVAFGAVYPLLVLVITEVFGQERVASNYMIFDGLPGAIGVFLIGHLLVSYVYDQHTAAGESECHGDDCFLLSHLIVVGVEAFGCILGAVLASRTWVIYRTLARKN